MCLPGTILGPVIGGAFADSAATWRWAFYINLLIIAPIAPIVFIYLPSVQPLPSVSLRQKISELDYLGALLNACIYVAWVLALQFGGSTWAWSDGKTIACFVIAGVGAAAFLITQYHLVFTTPEHRLFPIEFLKRRTMMLLFLGSSCISSALFIVIFYVPVFFEFVNGDSGVQSAVRLLPFVLTLVICNLINGYTMPLVSYYMPWYMFSGALITTGGGKIVTFCWFSLLSDVLTSLNSHDDDRYSFYVKLFHLRRYLPPWYWHRLNYQLSLQHRYCQSSN